VSQTPTVDIDSLSKRRGPHPLIAGVLSAFIPGVGQAYKRQPRKSAIFILLLVAIALTIALGRLPATFIGIWLTQILAIGLVGAAVWDALYSPAPSNPRVSRWWALLYLPLASVGIYILINLWSIAAGFRIYSVPSKSMDPTIQPGESIVVDTRYYERQRPDRGDVIVINHQGYLSLKRIIGLPGDTVEGGPAGVFVNGKLYPQPYAVHIYGGIGPYSTFGPVTVPAGELLVLGDNRDISYDSRVPEFGRLHLPQIDAKPLYILRSTSRERWGKRIE
jgi:signal peptidase I